MNKFFLIAVEFLRKNWMYVAAIIGIVFLWRTLFVSKNKRVTHEYKTGGKETLTREDATAIAERLYSAMADVGTDLSLIDGAFLKVSNNLDNLRLVYNAFGSRDYGTFGSPAYSWLPSSPTDLRGWLRNELSWDRAASWETLFIAAGIN